MGTSYYNIHNLTQVRKKLRNDQTEYEKILWGVLKGSQFMDLKFRRQHSVGRYIIDFYCVSRKIGIELDGKHHNNSNVMEYDSIRNNYLESAGIKICRFRNSEVEENLEGVLNKLKQFIFH